MEDVLAGLSDEQRSAVTHVAGELALLGGAGTGKTRTLVARFAWLVEQGVAPEQILVVARGQSAADKLRTQIEEALGDRAFSELAVHTATSLATRLLHDEAAETGLNPFTTVAGSADRLALLLARMDELPLSRHDLAGRPAATVARLIARIDRCKEALVTAEEFAAWADALPDDDARAEREREFAAVYAAHDRMLAAQDTLDAGEVVLRALALLRDRPHVRARCAARHLHVLADDHDASSPAAIALLQALTSEHGHLFAIGGDAEQRVVLTRSFHAKERILTAAGADTTGEPGGTVRFWRCSNERAQAQGVAGEIERLIRDGAKPEDIGVVVRSVRNEGQAVAVALEERAVPYRLVGTAAFFQHAEVRDVLAWLRLLVDPGDSAAVVRALARGPIELRSIDLARCVQISRRRKLDMIGALAAATESPQVPPEARDRILAFLKLHGQTSRALDTMRPDLFVHRLIDRLGLRRAQLFAAQADVVERLLALARLGELAAQYTARAPQATARDFGRYLAAVADAGLRDEEELDAGAGMPRGAVAVLAMHAAQEASLKHVFILGMQASRVPGARMELVEPVPRELLGADASADDRDEHVAHMRRLFGIAVTRASESVVLAYASESDRGARQPPSPFAEEAREALGAEWEDRVEELFGPDEALHATYSTMRDELLRSVPRVSTQLNDLRLDTDLDITHGVTRYLELVKLAALIERPAGQSVADALEDINAKLLSAASAHQREVFLTSGLDEVILSAEADARARAAAIAARAEPSLAPFLPMRGEGLVLSASDIETYRSCPLKYKFARVFRIPSEPTVNQRFGIVVHQVLERFHAGTDTSQQEILGLLEGSWRRSGFSDATEEERQLHAKAVAALTRYHERLDSEPGEPVWLEKSFQFKMGRHVLRGRVDRVDRLPDGEYELIDYKTGRPRTVAQLREDVQLSLYAVGAREAWELESSRQAYLYVLDDQKVRVPTEEIDRDWIEDTVMSVADGILAQDFEPTPSFSACSMCDHRIACPAAER